jgi:organic radical activating enzyme
MDHQKIFQTTKEELDKVSPSFCVAKWNQLSLHLGTGMNHSCHHPSPHKISIDEIKINTSALHNTSYKKEQRKLMLEGKRPSECDYCWRTEDAVINDNESNIFSERITKSADAWALPHLNKIKSLPWDADVNPTYLEVSFDTACNFKCAYCSPGYSSTWKQEIEQYGPYNLQDLTLHSLDYLKETGQMPLPITKPNPYIDAFWQWWPDVVGDLHTFRITGGEPLMSKQVFRVLDFLIENPQPQMEFSINSNLDVPKNLINQFIEKMQTIQEKKAVKSFKLFTSNEAHGKQAEYIRFGLNYNRWLANCHRVLAEIPNSHLTVMAAYNILSMPSFKLLMDDILDMKRKYTLQPVRKNPVSLDIPYIRWPEFLAPWVADSRFLPMVEDAVTHMFRNLHQLNWPPLCGKGFFDFEVNRIERLYFTVRDEMMRSHKDPDVIGPLRAQFAEYITEYDLRRGTNFVETFPELADFYQEAKMYTVRWQTKGPF